MSNLGTNHAKNLAIHYALSMARLKELLIYDQETGIFTWRVSRGRRSAGSVAGCYDQDGYILIRIDRRNYIAHRLAFLYITGHFPVSQVDHIDLNKENNRWTNLRASTTSENNRNMPPRQNKKHPLKGITPHKRNGRFRSTIFVNSKQLHLGYFDCPAAAHLAYVVAADTHYGEFARANGNA